MSAPPLMVLEQPSIRHYQPSIPPLVDRTMTAKMDPSGMTSVSEISTNGTIIAKSPNSGDEPFFAGRLSKPMSDLLRNHNEKPRLEWERRNLDFVVQVDLAHTVMLAEQRLLTNAQASDILQQLRSIRRAGPEGFAVTPGYGSIVLQIEKTLAKTLGDDTAGRLSIARSRLDQGPTVWRMSDRVHILSVTKALLTLQESFVNVAVNHGDTAMVSYTHLQQAQPATFGHYLLAFRDRLQDCFEQLQEVYSRVDRCPLGAVGLSGTDLPIDRNRTATLLGFSKLVKNARQGRDAYYQIEIVFVLAMTLSVVNDFCTEMHVYSSTEFGTIELDDSHCSTSSIFPQKKNPYALETVRGKCGEAQGWVTSAFSMFRNEGTHDHANRSLGFLNGACDTTRDMLLLTAEILNKLTVKSERYSDLLDKAWVTTNRLANTLLVDHGMNYRGAHSVVARLVKLCLDRHVSKSDVSVELLQTAARQMNVGVIDITQEQLTAALSHREFIQQSNSLGGIGPKQFCRLLADGTVSDSDNHAWIAGKEYHLAEAAEKLNSAVHSLLMN